LARPRWLIGARVDADGASAQALAQRCCRLPLALRMAAEHAAARPGTSLDDLAAELGDQQQRLDILDAGGDPGTAVRAVFSWSYRHLDAATARGFRPAGSASPGSRPRLPLFRRSPSLQRHGPGSTPSCPSW
jgi:hypothetical protein